MKMNFGTETKSLEIPFIIKPRISSNLTDLVGLGLLRSVGMSRPLTTKMFLETHQKLKQKGKKYCKMTSRK
jgi:hypothetical protein